MQGRTCLLCALCAMWLALPSEAGKLDSFEAEATGKPKPPTESSTTEEDDEESVVREETRKQRPDGSYAEDSSLIEELMASFFTDIVIGGGVRSWRRVSYYDRTVPRDEPAPREFGDPIIPFLRAGLSYRDIGADVDAMDYRIEVGFGLIGAPVVLVS